MSEDMAGRAGIGPVPELGLARISYCVESPCRRSSHGSVYLPSFIILRSDTPSGSTFTRIDMLSSIGEGRLRGPWKHSVAICLRFGACQSSFELDRQ